MSATTVRAMMLGAVGTALLTAATWWLLRTAVSLWPGTEAVPVHAGLGFLAVMASGLVAGWASILLGSATASLVRTSSWRPDRGLTGRVAAGLLVAASLGAVPATAAEPAASARVAAAPVQVTAPHVLASSTTAEGDAAGETAQVTVPDDLPVPGWTPTVATPQPVRTVTGEVSLVSSAAGAPVEDELVVRRGDTLWGIAARHLGEHATDQDVAEAWPRWYAANRDVIGPDPDLIHPGQRLVVPTSGGAR